MIATFEKPVCSPRVIRNEEQYQEYLALFEELFFLENRTQEQEDLFDTLALLIGDYEDKQYPTPDASPADVLKHLMEVRGMSQADLVKVTGLKSGRVSEIVNGKREISKELAKKLASFFEVQPGLFI